MAKTALEYKLDPRNARRHPEPNKAAVEKSLRELGAGRSIVVDADGVVIGGNAVYEQALKLRIPVKEIQTSGDELVVVRRVDLATDDPRRKALALADNQIALLAEWEPLILEEIKGELAGQIDFDAMGFDDPAKPIDDDAAAAEMVDRAEELLAKWGVERGQVWEIPGKAGVHRVMCGDSTDAGDVALLLAGEKPYLMVTDPPYGVDYDPEWRADAGVNKNRKKMGRVTNDTISDWEPAWRWFEGDVAYVWHAGVNASTVQASLERCQFAIRAQIIWAKDRMALSRGDYHWQHEPCWYAVREGKAGRRTADRSQTTLWSIPARDDSGYGHGTQKPVECMARPLRNHESGTAYDPFLGSGTTVVAAEQEGWICLAMELEPKYVAVSLERLAALGLEPVIANG